VKFLHPAVTVLLASHMKPYLRDALASVAAQTRTDMQVLVVDSGRWVGQDDERSKQMAAVYEDWQAHPLVEWVFTGEDPVLRQRVCPIGWVTNEVIRAGLVRGRYVCTFYDDDRYDPRFVEVMAGQLDAHPDVAAVWCSEDRVRLDGDVEYPVGHIPAGGVLSGPVCDNHVDGAQVMFRRACLDAIGDPWLPEDPAVSVCRHSDGIFLDKLASLFPVHPVPEVLVTHRFTPISTYTPC
jgi:hypothetical protein